MTDTTEFQGIKWVQAKPLLLPGKDRVKCYCEVGLNNGEQYEFSVHWDVVRGELVEPLPAHAWHSADNFVKVESDEHFRPEVQAVREVVVSRMKQAILTYRLTGVMP